MTGPDNVRLTVIIPTYNRVESLIRSLESIELQDLEQSEEFEVVVVDNAADPVLQERIRMFNLSASRAVRYVPERQLGVHYARHAGARVAKGDILVFTDDDAMFDPGWLEAYRKAFDSRPEMMAAGGPVHPVWESPPPDWLIPYIKEYRDFGALSLTELGDGCRIDLNGSFFSVNMAIRRQALWSCGGFNPEATGDTWLGDGETGLNNKLINRGMLVGHVPDAIVYHHIPRSRCSVEYLCQRWANEAACTEYRAFQKGIPNSLGFISRMVRIILGWFMRSMKTILRAEVRKDHLWVIRLRILVAYHAARLQYVLRLVYDEDFRRFVTKKDWL